MKQRNGINLASTPLPTAQQLENILIVLTRWCTEQLGEVSEEELNIELNNRLENIYN